MIGLYINVAWNVIEQIQYYRSEQFSTSEVALPIASALIRLSPKRVKCELYNSPFMLTNWSTYPTHSNLNNHIKEHSSLHLRELKHYLSLCNIANPQLQQQSRLNLTWGSETDTKPNLMQILAQASSVWVIVFLLSTITAQFGAHEHQEWTYIFCTSDNRHIKRAVLATLVI